MTEITQYIKKHRKVFIKTLGCQMNEYDSSRMKEVLQEHLNTKQTHDHNEADILLINTCSIRERAQEKVFHELGRWKKLKAKNPSKSSSMLNWEGF